ncbi:hypothetical protein [Nocardioides currus]|uniref:Uncharacterized protein n=1 Tax=Nocardioides currus TaxID=2133958 RepID=A0A2R7YW47_9ACTN|nr:hypothetical protein [Nocardioides currus]PUA80637.1 hypothetical protein C7S10_12840 [Nocardioides currus]
MTTRDPASHLVHDELAPASELAADCRATGLNLRLERVARAAASTPPSIRYEDFPTDRPKREITISEAATRLANALHLHLD